MKKPQRPNVNNSESAFRDKYHKNKDEIIKGKSLCTSCNSSLQQNITKGKIWVHPFLDTLMCKKCYDFYGDGNFSCDDEDGSDKYCRWCGQGGTLFLCSYCTGGFCKKCIKRNLPRSVLHDVEADDWKCFCCDVSPLYPLRADCNIVKKYIDDKFNQKGESSINKKGGSDDEENPKKRKAKKPVVTISDSDSDDESSKKRKTSKKKSRASSDEETDDGNKKKINKNKRKGRDSTVSDTDDDSKTTKKKARARSMSDSGGDSKMKTRKKKEKVRASSVSDSDDDSKTTKKKAKKRLSISDDTDDEKKMKTNKKRKASESDDDYGYKEKKSLKKSRVEPESDNDSERPKKLRKTMKKKYYDDSDQEKDKKKKSKKKSESLHSDDEDEKFPKKREKRVSEPKKSESKKLIKKSNSAVIVIGLVNDLQTIGDELVLKTGNMLKKMTPKSSWNHCQTACQRIGTQLTLTQEKLKLYRENYQKLSAAMEKMHKGKDIETNGSSKIVIEDKEKEDDIENKSSNGEEHSSFEEKPIEVDDTHISDEKIAGKETDSDEDLTKRRVVNSDDEDAFDNLKNS